MGKIINKNILVVPNRYSKAKLEDCDEIVQEIFKKFLMNLKEYSKQGVAPSFFGTSGQGKTHAAAALALHLKSKEIPVKWCNTLEDLNLLRDYKIFGNTTDYFVEYKLLTESPIVIMDDITMINDINRLKEQFSTIVSKRYNSKLLTVFTGSLRAATKDSFNRELTDSFGPSITRRIDLKSKGLLYIG